MLDTVPTEELLRGWTLSHAYDHSQQTHCEQVEGTARRDQQARMPVVCYFVSHKATLHAQGPESTR